MLTDEYKLALVSSYLSIAANFTEGDVAFGEANVTAAVQNRHRRLADGNLFIIPGQLNCVLFSCSPASNNGTPVNVSLR